MYYLAFFSLLSAATYLGCEKTGIPPAGEVLLESPSTPAPATGALADRADDCGDCPVDDCCCGIEILSGGLPQADIVLCGTSDGTDNCGPVSPGGGCPTISGGGQSFTLNISTNPRHIFCISKNAAFEIGNLESGSIRIRITCQAELTNPQDSILTIPATSKVYYQTNGDCEVDPC